MGGQNISKFQLFLLGGFVFIIIVSVIVFSKYKGSSGGQSEVVIWGTFDSAVWNDILTGSQLKQDKTVNVIYEEIEEDKFDNELLEALASGGGPDLFILPQDKIYKQKNKILVLPYTAYSERDFKNSFVEGGEIFLSSEGIVALPIFVDPLVMYWNRDLFNQAKITLPPKYWDQLYTTASALSKKDGALNITQSAVAFGEFANVDNSKAVLANLLLQAGTPITSQSQSGPRSALSDSFGKAIMPGEAALNFYTEFSNPIKPFYSWNRALPSSQNYFLSGDLGLYFGFASELAELQLKNPNLNFDVDYVPSSREGGTYVSYANFYGLAISKNSLNANAAFRVASILSSQAGAKAIEQVLNLPSARRDLLATKPTDVYKDVFYGSAIRSKAWLDPDPAMTTAIFKNLVESITSGRERTATAVSHASSEIGNLFK
jgi:ABC-type glycerol-3-phosphate transport system substrate-binding protein